MIYKTITYSISILAICGSLTQCATMPAPPVPALNEIQFIGSHNSYKQAIEPRLLGLLAADSEATAASLDYSHVPLGDQLDAGMRKLEIDIFHDPDGGRYVSPMGMTVFENPVPYDPDGVMTGPGFKVFHIQDIDFRSHCLLLTQCLSDVRRWSDAHPRHLPLVITINAKDGVIDRPGFVKPVPFDSLAWDALDAEIRSVLADRLLVPDDVRREGMSLRESVQAGWPGLSEARGRILFVLDDSAAKKNGYAEGHPSLAGRVMFIDAPEDTPEAAIRIVNNPVRDREYIRQLVEAGFIVRTRSDADTVEAQSGDNSRFDAALMSGAQIISTDYYLEDPRFPGFRIGLPGGAVARCNPVLLPDCDVEAIAED